jgi:hypothetical protein
MVKEKIARGASKKRVQDLIQLARKYGIKHLKVGEIEFTLLPDSIGEPSIDNKAEPNQTEDDSNSPTDEEFLFMSTGHYDEIQSKKQSKQL